METASHLVRDIAAGDRAAIERLLGQTLSDDQQVVIRVVSPQDAVTKSSTGGPGQHSDSVPTSWRVFEGMTKAQLDGLDATLAQRPAFSRPNDPT